jgi:hypothetical protein
MIYQLSILKLDNGRENRFFARYQALLDDRNEAEIKTYLISKISGEGIVIKN